MGLNSITRYRKVPGNMYINIWFSLTFLFIVTTSGFSSNENGAYGLYFTSHEAVKDQRTELNLFTEKGIELKEEFEFSFDLFIRPGQEWSHYFGYIVRSILDNKTNFDLVYNYLSSESKNFSLIIGENVSGISFNVDEKEIFNKWYKLRFRIDLVEKSLTLFTPDTFYIEKNLNISSTPTLKFVFGASSYGNFVTTDIPPMNIRDIKVESKGKLLYHWPLNETQGSYAKDIVKSKKVHVTKPQWLKMKHHDWELEQRLNLDGMVLLAFDKENERIFITTKDQILSYSVHLNQVESISYLEGGPIVKDGCQAIYNHRLGKIYTYNVDKKKISSFDFNTGKWDLQVDNRATNVNYSQHNKFISTKSNSLYIVGGYGHHRYKNDVFRYDFMSKKWDSLSVGGDVLNPRYLAGIGVNESSGLAYIVGGFGSVSGDQILNPRYYFDLISFNAEEQKFKKIQNLQAPVESFCFANSIYIDPVTEDFYGLVFPKHKYDGYLQLIKGSLDDSICYEMGNKIPYLFLDTKSFADFYYCPNINKLLTVTTFFKDNNQTDINIYSLVYPPNISEDDFLEAKKKRYVQKLVLLGLLVVIALILLMFYVLWRRKKKVSKEKEIFDVSDGESGKQELSVMDIPKRSSILFFGGFQFFDKAGDDITKQFTPLLKELFLLIFLNSVKNEKGISNEKLIEVLWFDKPESSARNNKSVNIAKLRNILENVGHVELTQRTGYWKFDYENWNIYSDYLECIRILKSKREKTRQKIFDLIQITKRGPFLFNLRYEWLDDFKEEISNMIIDTLFEYIESIEIKDDPNFIIDLADSIFNFDSVNEEAMVIKCKALISLGKHSLAKKVYSKFVKEFKLLYDIDFEHDFSEVMNR